MIIPRAPQGVSLSLNMTTARLQKNTFKNGGDAFLFSWFYKQVRNKGPWDYKQGGPEFEDFGNFHYGAVGTAAGISEQVLLRAAGGAQFMAGTTGINVIWTDWFESPFGDDENDQYWIKEGIRHAQIFC